MNTSRVAHLHVARDNVVTRCFQDRLFQRAHAQSIKRAKENVTLTLAHCRGGGERNRSEQNNLPTRSACVSYRFPLRTISTTARIASITSCGCSLCISWQLFVLVMLSSIGNKFRELLVR